MVAWADEYNVHHSETIRNTSVVRVGGCIFDPGLMCLLGFRVPQVNRKPFNIKNEVTLCDKFHNNLITSSSYTLPLNIPLFSTLHQTLTSLTQFDYSDILLLCSLIEKGFKSSPPYTPRKGIGPSTSGWRLTNYRHSWAWLHGVDQMRDLQGEPGMCFQGDCIGRWM